MDSLPVTLGTAYSGLTGYSVTVYTEYDVMGNESMDLNVDTNIETWTSVLSEYNCLPRWEKQSFLYNVKIFNRVFKNKLKKVFRLSKAQAIQI